MIDDDFLTPEEAAKYLHTTENTLRCMRSKGMGPPFHKPDGWHIRYRRGELDAYHAACLPSGRKKRMDRAMAERERAVPGSTPTRP